MIKVRRLGPQIGAEIRGVDVKTLDDASFAVIYRAWLDSNVIVVPGQELQIEDFLRYSRRFGLVLPHPSKMTRHPDYPEITVLGVNKFGPDGALDLAIYRRGAEGWHTDGAYDQEPFKATQLYALAVPSRGGDTFFASMYAAYDALPQRLKQLLEGRKGAFTYGGRRKATALLNEEDRDWTPVWFAAADGRLYVFTAVQSGKVKRLRHSQRARVSPSDARGRVRGEWREATARILTDPREIERAHAALQGKYGWQMRLTNLLSRITGRINHRAWLEIQL